MPPLTFSGSGFVSPQGSHQNGSLRHSMEYTLGICPIFRGTSVWQWTGSHPHS